MLENCREPNRNLFQLDGSRNYLSNTTKAIIGLMVFMNEVLKSFADDSTFPPQFPRTSLSWESFPQLTD